MAKAAKASGTSRNQLLILAALSAVLVGILAYMFLLSGGEEPVDDAAAPVTPASAPVTPEKKDAGEDKDKPADDRAPKDDKGGDESDDGSLVETSQTFKDPFKPLVDEGEGSGAGTEEPESDDSTEESEVITNEVAPTSPGSSTTGVAPPASPPTSPDPTTGAKGEDSRTVGGQKVRLLGFGRLGGKDTALIAVGEKVYAPSQGALFAKDFLLESMKEPCVDLMYGDLGFTLCLN